MSSQPPEVASGMPASAESAADATDNKPRVNRLEAFLKQLRALAKLPFLMVIVIMAAAIATPFLPLLLSWLTRYTASHGWVAWMVSALGWLSAHCRWQQHGWLFPHFNPATMAWGGLQWSCVGLFVFGLVFLAWPVIQFTWYGETIDPGDEPKQFIIRGLYRIMRHPMFLGVFCMQIAEVGLFWSGSALVWFGIFSVIVVPSILHFDGKRQLRLFGPAYAEYMTEVPGFFFLWPLILWVVLRRKPYKGVLQRVAQPEDDSPEPAPQAA